MLLRVGYVTKIKPIDKLTGYTAEMQTYTLPGSNTAPLREQSGEATACSLFLKDEQGPSAVINNFITCDRLGKGKNDDNGPGFVDDVRYISDTFMRPWLGIPHGIGASRCNA